MRKSYDVILFDLDGTLTDPGMGITNSVAYAMRHYGLAVPPRSELYKYIGPPLVGSFEKWCGFSREKAVEAVEVYREYFSDKGIFENERYEGIPELLKKLKSAGKRLIIATSKPTEFTVRILEHFGLAEYFEFVAGANMGETRTRKSEVIEYAFSECGITDRSSAIMVGDREHDVNGAHEAGIECIGVLYGYGSRAELVNAGADALAESVSELEKLLIG